MPQILGGVGLLRVCTSLIFQLVRIHLLYSSLTLFRCECDFAQPRLYFSIPKRTWNIFDW